MIFLAIGLGIFTTASAAWTCQPDYGQTDPFANCVVTGEQGVVGDADFFADDVNDATITPSNNNTGANMVANNLGASAGSSISISAEQKRVLFVRLAKLIELLPFNN